MKQVYVYPAAQGRGVGKAVVQFLEDKARDLGAREIYMESWTFPDTIEFNQNRGYRSIGRNDHGPAGKGPLEVLVLKKPLILLS